jgi:hypothetical protein
MLEILIRCQEDVEVTRRELQSALFRMPFQPIAATVRT